MKAVCKLLELTSRSGLQLCHVFKIGFCLLACSPCRELQKVLQQGAATLQSTEKQDRKTQGWKTEALQAAEAAYIEQLKQEAQEGVASCRGACKVDVPFDFWVHVLEKHEGTGTRQMQPG